MSQQLHPDYQTNPPETEYFFLGNGEVMAAIQWSRNTAITPLGIMMSQPEHFSRKWSTLLFHPEHGLSRTAIVVTVNGKRYRAEHATTTVKWILEEPPYVEATWQAGEAEVTEMFRVSEGTRSLRREITIKHGLDVVIETSLYANPALFDQFGTNAHGLEAHGYADIYIECEQPSITLERTLTIRGGHAVLHYGLNALTDADLKFSNAELAYSNTVSRFNANADADDLTKRSIELLHKSAAGLRAAVATNGRFDASIWQYGFEWSGDAAHVAEALVYCGQFERAKRVFENILTRLSNERGQVMESSRFRGSEDAELNNNGAVLAALGTYFDWTGDGAFITKHFERITAITNLLIAPEYLDASTSLLKASRDIWERSAMMGVEPGYDVSHNSFGIVGLEAAAHLAEIAGVPNERWRTVASKMRKNFCEHLSHSFIEDGRVIKRRTLDGKWQRTVRVVETESNKDFLAVFRPKGTPMEATPVAPWEPDASEVFPICHGVIDGDSAVAKKTMAAIEELWSQAWQGGGYGRYHVAAEPDSPGPWPFATAFIASAYAEMNEMEHTRRALEWLIEKAGAGGSWFEFYGDRPTPPLPPTGIIVWGWAEYVKLMVRHIMAARVIDNKLSASSKFAGIGGRLRFRDSFVDFPS